MKHHKSSNERTAVHVCPSTLHSGLMSLIGQPGLCQTDPLRKGCRSDRGQFGDVTNSFLSNIWDVQFTSGMSSFLLKTDHRTCISELITKLSDFAHGWQWLLHEKCWIKRLSLEYDVEKVINVKHVQSFPSFPGTWSTQSTKKEQKVQESLRRASELDKNGKKETKKEKKVQESLRRNSQLEEKGKKEREESPGESPKKLSLCSLQLIFPFHLSTSWKSMDKILQPFKCVFVRIIMIYLLQQSHSSHIGP